MLDLFLEFIGNIDLVSLISNPTNAVIGGFMAIIVYNMYKILNSIFNPVQYVRKLYKMADNIVLGADDNLIDKIRNKQIKDDVTAELISVLKERPAEIQKLINTIGD